MQIKKLFLFLSIFSWTFVQANHNFKTRHKPGVMRHNYHLVGQWHIKFIEQANKSADWFLYKQIEQRQDGIAVRYKIVIVTQQDFMISSSRPFPVAVTKKRPDKNKPARIHTIMLGQVFKLDLASGTLYQVQKPKDKVIGYILT